MDGILNIYKEQGYTSHDVVAKLRGILHTKRIGHTGTLDPAAEGVLPVCIGKATGLCEMLTDKTKTYETVMRLGVETDTQDATGTILAKHPVTVAEEEVRQAVRSFLGTYRQTPPMYSAKKVGGKKLYELAREGREVFREPVAVELTELEILDLSLPRVRLRVTCSKGTYIRTLCADIGQALGCGACMETLLRTRSGTFSLETALRLSEVEALMRQGKLEEVLIPLEAPFQTLPRLSVTEAGERRLLNGNPLPEDMICWPKSPQRDCDLRICSTSGMFVGVYRFRPEQGLYWPQKLFLKK